MFKVLFALILSSFIILAASVYFYTGAYKDVFIVEPKPYEFKMVYKVHVGPYHHINEDIESVEKWAQENGHLCKMTFAQFLDDPQTMAEDRLKSHVGCLVDSIVTKLPQDLFYKEEETQTYIKARFDGAPSIGPFVVYPQLMKWADENQWTPQQPSIEVYSFPRPNEMITEYYLPVSRKKNNQK